MTGPIDRRSVLTAAAALAAAGAAGARRAVAQVQPVSVAAVLRPVFGDKPIKPGRVQLKLPVVAENGSSVQVSLGMEGAELPKRMVLMAPANPQPLATEIRFGPRAVRAEVTTRLRLARSQVIVAAAEMADGSVYATSAEVTITSGACIELGE
jgi:sulfur-oxidizing protein SoxY